MSLPSILQRNWFFLGLFFVIFLGIRFPQLGLGLKPWINYFVFLSLFLVGFRFEREDFTLSIGMLKAVSLSLFCGFVLMPLLSLGLAYLLFAHDPEMFTGVILAGAVPTTQASSVIWTDMCAGNHALALVIMVVLNVVGVFISPFILSLSLAKTVQVPVTEMLTTLVIFVLLPSILGFSLRCRVALIPGKVLRFSRVLSILLIWSTVLTALSSGDVLSLPLPKVLLCVALQYSISAVAAFGLSRAFRLPRRDAIAVMFCSAQVTITFAAVVGFSYFATASIIYVVVYHLFQQFMGQVTAKILAVEPPK